METKIPKVMKTIDPEIKKVIEAVHYRPAVSIILPFEAKINLETELRHALKLAGDKVELQIQENFTQETCKILMKKLRNIFANVKLDSTKKGIAIYVSLIFEKIFYLEAKVEQKIVVDNTFEIRDLVYSSKNSNQYLLLVLSANKSKVYLSHNHDSIKLIPGTTLKSATFLSDKTKNEHISLYPDISKHKEIEMEKFLLYVDNELDTIIKKYNLPIFILGATRTTAHFKKITKHTENIVDFIFGNFEEATVAELAKLIAPYFAKLNTEYQKQLLKKIDEADSEKKLAVGIQNVWREAVNKKGGLLVVEKNYTFAADRGGSPEVIYKAEEPYNKYSLIKDAVDDVIEKVLEYGGDVEFVEDDTLKNYENIALILYY